MMKVSTLSATSVGNIRSLALGKGGRRVPTLDPGLQAACKTKKLIQPQNYTDLGEKSFPRLQMGHHPLETTFWSSSGTQHRSKASRRRCVNKSLHLCQCL
jgi:hypothetical protein